MTAKATITLEFNDYSDALRLGALVDATSQLQKPDVAKVTRDELCNLIRRGRLVDSEVKRIK